MEDDFALHDALIDQLDHSRAGCLPFVGYWLNVRDREEPTEVRTLLIIHPGCMAFYRRHPNDGDGMDLGRVWFQMMPGEVDGRRVIYTSRVRSEGEPPEALFTVEGLTEDTLTINIWSDRADLFLRTRKEDLGEFGIDQDLLEYEDQNLLGWSNKMSFMDDPVDPEPPRRGLLGYLRRLLP